MNRTEKKSKELKDLFIEVTFDDKCENVKVLVAVLTIAQVIQANGYSVIILDLPDPEKPDKNIIFPVKESYEEIKKMIMEKITKAKRKTPVKMGAENE